MNILEYMKNNILYLDGGMGTLLQEKGLSAGEYPERWNVSHPEVVENIHRAYYDAGSNVVNTNTFGANILKFSAEELEKTVSAAMKNAENAREKSTGMQEKFIALDIGPTGRMLKPYGDFDFEDAVSVFAETVKLGVKYGADLIFIETMNDSYETKAALLAAKENSDLPVFVSNAYGEDGKLMTGATPEAMAALLEGMGADAIGANCSFGPDKLGDVAERLLKFCSVPVILKPNAGMPVSRNGRTEYDISPSDFAEHIKKQIINGIRIAGGCCGTTPEYIAKMVSETKKITPKPIEKKDITCISSYTHTVCFGENPVLIGERINPTGKKRFKQALAENDIGYILQEGIKQQECGVHVLDVNVGLPEINEKEMLRSAVCELQAVTDLPLQVDTSDFSAMEEALRRYNGKALVNSVNGTRESMKNIFPLVKKYGGAVIALTLDESGIPSDAVGRVKIAEKIIAEAEKYGIDKKDIIFDTLAMTVSAEPNAAKVSLEALSIIKNKLGCHTSLGVSNVSFGLPSRDAINAAFFTSALENGLSAAIMNPYSKDMLKSYYAYRALHGLDENCADYISFAEREIQKNEAIPQNNEITLESAIEKGLCEKAEEITRKLLETEKPIDIVNTMIIPALDKVGVGFENKTVYLPQLLMSAESAKHAFETIKSVMPPKKNDNKSLGFVIATVQGDIHDIGKNIVKLMLENYGFSVTDLGKDVPSALIAETVKKLGAPVLGLSALMTTTVPAMESTIKLVRRTSPECKIVVGGAVLTEDYAMSIGADKYAADAMETVRYAESVCGK